MNLNIGWLYPELMSTYGDRGNIIALKYRALKRGIKAKVFPISLQEKGDLLIKMDILFMGGAQDKQQEIVNQDLIKNKGRFLEKAINSQIVGLFICGAYQFLGQYYLTADGVKIKGLGFFDLYTVNPGLKEKRLIGNVVSKTFINFDDQKPLIIVGFENHGGRTYLNNKKTAFAKIIHGYGNNGIDKTEGIWYQNVIGTYLHGPILPKNPLLTDFLIKQALERKYRQKINLKRLNDWFEEKARTTVLKKFSIIRL